MELHGETANLMERQGFQGSAAGEPLQPPQIAPIGRQGMGAGSPLMGERVDETTDDRRELDAGAGFVGHPATRSRAAEAMSPMRFR